MVCLSFILLCLTVAPAKNTAQIMVEIDLNKTKKFDTRQELVEYLQSELDSKISGGTATIKFLEQAQPIRAPVRIRLTWDDLEKLNSASDQIQKKSNNIPIKQIEKLLKKIMRLSIGLLYRYYSIFIHKFKI